MIDDDCPEKFLGFTDATAGCHHDCGVGVNPISRTPQIPRLEGGRLYAAQNQGWLQKENRPADNIRAALMCLEGVNQSSSSSAV